MMRNSLKTKLKQGQNVIGTWCEIPSPEVINVIAQAGLDFVIIDMEHGAMDFRLASQMTTAAQIEGTASLIRVAQNNKSEILRALEVGADGVVIPHIETAADRKNALDAIKYPPLGQRSLNPYTRAGGYRSSSKFTREQNQKTVTVVMIESKIGIENLREIIKDRQLDGIYIGTYDLSAALGVPGQTDHPRVKNELKHLVKTIRQKKKCVGCIFHDRHELKYLQKLGIQFLCYKLDTSVIFDEFRRAVTEFKH